MSKWLRNKQTGVVWAINEGPLLTRLLKDPDYEVVKKGPPARQKPPEPKGGPSKEDPKKGDSSKE